MQIEYREDEVVLVSVDDDIEEFIVPDEVTVIGVKCFYNHRHIKKVILSNLVKCIEDSAFENSSLEEIVMNELLMSIGKKCFKKSKIKRITIPDSVSFLEDECFYGSNLEHIEFNNMLTMICARCFYSCEYLNHIVLPDYLISIEDSAFYGCKSLTSINIPEFLIDLKSNAFHECIAIESINVDKNNPIYDSREDCNAIIETETNTLLLSCMNTILPSSIENIEDKAYSINPRQEIIIPGTIKNIYEGGCFNKYAKRLIVSEGVQYMHTLALYESMYHYIELPSTLKSDDLQLPFFLKDLIVPRCMHLDINILNPLNIYASKEAYKMYEELRDEDYWIIDIDTSINTEYLETINSIYQSYDFIRRPFLCVNNPLTNTDYSYLKAYSVIGYLKHSDFYDYDDIYHILIDINHAMMDIFIQTDMITQIIDYMINNHLINHHNYEILLQYYQGINNVEMVLKIIEISNLSIMDDLVNNL